MIILFQQFWLVSVNILINLQDLSAIEFCFFIFDADRKHLARKVNEQFFCPEMKKAVEPESDMDESTQKLIQLLQTSPELAGTLLQLSQMLKGN